MIESLVYARVLHPEKTPTGVFIYATQCIHYPNKNTPHARHLPIIKRILYEKYWYLTYQGKPKHKNNQMCLPDSLPDIRKTLQQFENMTLLAVSFLLESYTVQAA